MKNQITKALVSLSLIAALLASLTACAGQSSSTKEAPTANASSYPNQDIRMIVAFSTGGQTDLISRKISEIIQKNKILDASLITVNMPGGNTADAAQALCEADPDGYTFYMHHTAMITNNVMGTLDIAYTDMKLCGGIVDQGFGIVARANDDRFSNGKELVEYLRSHPGELSVAFPGYASAGHFALLSFLKANDLLGSVVEVPYEGGSEAISAHLSGETDLRATNMGDSIRYVASGDIKYLCMISQDKNKDYPDVQTLADLGAKDSGFMLRTAVFAPTETPDAITEKFMKAIEAACNTEEFRTFLNSNGLTLSLTNAQSISNIYAQDYQSITDMSSLLNTEN